MKIIAVIILSSLWACWCALVIPVLPETLITDVIGGALIGFSIGLL